VLLKNKEKLRGYTVYLTDEEVEAFMKIANEKGIDRFSTYAGIVIKNDIKEVE
jgi:hypothetical protein